MAGVGSRLANLVPRLMRQPGEGCGSGLEAKLDRAGPAWCRQNIVYILEELMARSHQAGCPWDREAAAEVVELTIRTVELRQR